jgi:hypothetical protein
MKYWTTAFGERKYLCDIDHQHLSNILWFLNIFWKLNSENSSSYRELKNELDSRFNGVKLPWKPLPIPGEVPKIREFCFIDKLGDIWLNANCIGTVSHIRGWRNM